MSTLDSFLQIYFQTLLDNEKGRMILQGSSWVYKLDVEFPQDLDQNLVHFKKCKISPYAQMAATSELFRVSDFRDLTDF